MEASHKILQETIETLAAILLDKNFLSLSWSSRVQESVQVFLQLLICGARMTSLYYQLFADHQSRINQDIIMKCLLLTKYETMEFDEQP
jgi:hypothetical protein